MAISNKEKLAYVLKYAPKSDEKIQKIIRLAATMDNPKSKLTPEQKDKVQEGLSKLYSRFQEINEQKKGQTKSATKKEPYFKKALQEFKQKVGKIEYKRATSKTDIKKDIERPALKAGKRFPKEGKTTNQYGTFKNNPKKPYWENRANRMDVNQPSKSKYPKLSEGGQTSENFKVGDRIKVLGDSYTILSFKVDKSQGYDEQRVVMKNDKGEILSYPLDMVVAYSKYAQGGGFDMLKEDDNVWNALGKKLIVDKVTKDEYFLVAFGQPSASPFSKSKVHSYLKSGKWSLKPSINQEKTLSEIYEMLLAADKARTKQEVEELLEAMVKAGISDNDLIAPKTKTGRNLSSSTFSKFKDKKTEELQKKMYAKYQGKLSGNQPFTIINKMIELANREPSIQTIKTFENKNVVESDELGSAEVKRAQGGVFEHGLSKGDKIVEVVDDKYLVIESKDGVMSVINIEKGGRFILGLDDSKDSGSRKDIGKVGLDEAMQYINYVKNQKMSNGGEFNDNSNSYAQGGALKTKKFSKGDKVIGEFMYKYGEGLQSVPLGSFAEQVSGVISNVKKIDSVTMYSIDFENGEILKFPDFAINKYIRKSGKFDNGGEIVVSDVEKKKSLKGNAKLKF